jgi:hypothetical protein
MPSTPTDRLSGLTASVAVKAPCRVATTAAITLSGLQTIDGVALAAGDRVLVKNQVSAIANGIYVAGTGTWVRAKDFNGTRDAVPGTLLFLQAGTVNANFAYRISGTSSEPVVIGTDEIEFELAFSEVFDAAEDAATAQGLAEDARDASIVAQGLSEDARDAAVVAQGLAEDAQSGAEDAAAEAGVNAGLAETAAGQAIAAAATIGLKIQTDPDTPTVPPSGAADGDHYLATETTASYLTLYLNTGGTGAPVDVDGEEIRIPLMNGIQDVIDTWPDVLEALGFETVTTRMGVQTVGAGASLYNATDASFTMFKATERTSLVGKNMALRIGALGSGAVSLGCYTGEPETGNLTCVWRDALPTATALADQVETWTAPSTRVVEAGQWLAFDFPSGGVKPRYSAGGRSYLKSGLLSVSASGAYASTGARIEAYIDTDQVVARDYPRSALAPELQTALSLAEAVGTEQTVWTGFTSQLDASASTVNFYGMIYVGTALYADYLRWFDVRYLTVGNGESRFGVVRGDLDDLPVLVADVALPAVASTGVKTYETSTDYAETFLEAGDHVFMIRPSGGSQLAHGAKTGTTALFVQDSVPGVGQRLEFNAGLTNRVAVARFGQTAKVLPTSKRATPTTHTIFCVGGQSNGVGLGNGGSPVLRSGTAKQFYGVGASSGWTITELLGDPVGNANVSSAWPAFAERWFERTGKIALFVPVAVLGSSLLEWGGSNWSTNGLLRDIAITALQDCFDAADTDNLAWEFGGMLWVEGETVATTIDVNIATPGTWPLVSEALYPVGMADLKTAIESGLGILAGKMPFLISETGNIVAGNTAGAQAVRRAQRVCVQTIENVHWGFIGARATAATELQGDNLHYTTSLLSRMGYSFAEVAAVRCSGGCL